MLADEQKGNAMTAEWTAAARAVPGDMPPGGLMRLVAGRLKARELSVRLPGYQDERRLSIDCRGGSCDLSVDDFGFVEWECAPWEDGGADCMVTANTAAFLLSGRDEGFSRKSSPEDDETTSFKGVVGRELQARGFDVSLDVYEDKAYFEVSAEILVTNPVIHPNASVRIDDDGIISWECDYPYEVALIADPVQYSAVLADPASLADSIASTIAHAISLSSGVSGGSR